MIAETAENPGDLVVILITLMSFLSLKCHSERSEESLQLLRIEEKSPTGEGNSLMREINKTKQTF